MVSAARRVLITGASDGVGKGIALSCGAAGWEVWIAARRTDKGRAAAELVGAVGGVGRFVSCDVTDEASVRAAVSAACEQGPLHGVVHNATSGWSGVAHQATDPSPDMLADQLAVGLRGLHALARAVHEPLRSTQGAFVVLTSEAGFEGKAKLAAYAAVKAAQRAYVRVLAREWGPDSIRVNALAPLAESPALADAFARDEVLRLRATGRIPLGRVGDAEADIGPVVRFLLDDDSTYLTGQCLMADGGSCPII